MKKNNRKGFTIVELVIVIAVIAILATVLVPTFGGIIDKANNSKLLQEIKNEYTDYSLENADKDDYSATIYVKIGTNFYLVTDGQVEVDADNAPKTSTPAANAKYWDGDSVETYSAT